MLIVAAIVQPTLAAWGVLSDMHNYHDCFGLDPNTCNYPNSGTSPKWKLQGQYKVVLIEANAGQRGCGRFRVERSCF